LWRTVRTFLLVLLCVLVVLVVVLALRSWLAHPMAPPLVTVFRAVYLLA
jgi:hypothetical protein